MEITVLTQQGKVPVTVVQPHGDVDAVQLCRTGQEGGDTA